MPPSKGSFITNTSPGRSLSPHFARSVVIAWGTEPRWKGTVTPCATVSPSGSQIAAEKSIPSRTTVEWAVRKIVVAISSAIDASALPTICCVTGSTFTENRPAPAPAKPAPPSGAACTHRPRPHWSLRRAYGSSCALQDERLGGRVAPHGPSGPDDDRRVVLVDKQRARLGALTD